jgi:hypothetical protein
MQEGEERERLLVSLNSLRLSRHDSAGTLFKLIRQLTESMAKTTKPGFYAG